ncbi:MAG: hypothetical protein OEO19_04370 [Gammaproteobacteria bacterium]|nr:hypothetical protein [Gammaproteobacteria bacterium]MDH3449316.1 hypothetical protein [Gammaproteobacteria bacterium]
MKILSKLQSLAGKKSSKDEHALAEKLEIAEATKKKSISHFFVLQALEVLKKLELDGGTFICSSPDFECYFKKKYMPLFEEKNAYIKVAFDKANNVTHVCGLLPRLQHEKDRNKLDDEKITLSKMPDCLLSHAIGELSLASKNNVSKAGNVVNQGQTASTQQQISKARNVVNQGQTASTQQKISNFVFDPYASIRSLKGVEKEWLDSMHASLIGSEYEILLHLLQYSIIARGFQETIEHFLITKKELQPGSRSVVINSFKYLAREFQFNEQTISVAQIGSSLEQMFNLKPKETFSIIVELFFCLGYEKEIKGYTTGFIELI